MAPGNIILLNGTSSADKLRIIAALQDVLEVPYLNVGIDKFSSIMPDLGQAHPQWTELQGQTHLAQALKQSSSLGSQLISGMHQTIAGLARTGHHLIVDHILLDAGWLRECAHLFWDLPTFFVGVRCAPAVLAYREQESGSGAFDHLQAQFAAVHTPGVYDLELDTALLSPLECALQIKRRMLAGPPPSAMRWLKTWGDHAKLRGWLRQNEQYNRRITTQNWL